MVTKEQAQMLTTLALACRPSGAPRWDAPGVMAALAKVNQLALGDVVMATIRAASDRTAATPAVIAATNSLHWTEKPAERTPWRPPKRDELCRIDGHSAYPANNCSACATEGRESEYGEQAAAPAIDPGLRGAEAVRAVLRAGRAIETDSDERDAS